jgi:hypothetical protein
MRFAPGREIDHNGAGRMFDRDQQGGRACFDPIAKPTPIVGNV